MKERRRKNQGKKKKVELTIAKIPSNVSEEYAAFTTLGSIPTQGVRLASPLLGETFLVIGLGLIKS